MNHGSILPTINACLNAISAILLIGGWISIRHRNKENHKKFMIGALISSTLFLTFYVVNRIIVGGFSHYKGEGISKIIYFTVLGTHTPLAMIILPFSLMAVWHAYHQNFKAHVAITRWLLPVWIYVSVTGVVIYFMLYVF